MGSVILDFDSTLVPCESLELALSRSLADRPDALEEIAAITVAGMEGRIAFRASLEARLALARPTRDELTALGEELCATLTSGAEELVRGVIERGHEVWIVSGAFRETLLPVGRRLGLPDDRVQGVRAVWTEEGRFGGLDPADGFGHSKTRGARGLGAPWARPAVGVGDGMTDHALFAEGLVDHFVAFTEHAARAPLVAVAEHAARDMGEAARLVETWLP